MSLLVPEGFDTLSTSPSSSGLLNKVYASGATCYNVAGTVGQHRLAGVYDGYALRVDPFTGDYRWDIGSNLATAVFCLHVQRYENHASGAYFFRIEDRAAGVTQLALKMAGSQGQDLEVYRGLGTAQLGSTISDVFAYQTWVWLSIKVTIDNSSGSVEILDANGDSLFSVSSVDTQAGANAYTNAFSCRASNLTYVIDNLLVMDTTDSPTGTPFADHLEEQAIWTGFVSGDGDTSDWTASAGDRYACVDDEPAPDDDTTYVKSTGLAETVHFELDDPPSYISGIEAVLLQHRTKKDASGSRSVRTLLRRVGVDTDGDAVSLGASYVTYQDNYTETDPHTGLAWVPTGVEEMQAGMEVTA